MPHRRGDEPEFLVDEDGNNVTGIYVAVGAFVLALLLAAGRLLRDKRNMSAALEAEKLKNDELTLL